MSGEISDRPNSEASPNARADRDGTAVRVSRGWRDHRDDTGGNYRGAGGDAGVASPSRAGTLIDEIDDGAFVAIEEADELAEIRGSHVVEDSIEVAVIGHVERINPEPNVVCTLPPLFPRNGTRNMR